MIARTYVYVYRTILLYPGIRTYLRMGHATSRSRDAIGWRARCHASPNPNPKLHHRHRAVSPPLL